MYFQIFQVTNYQYIQGMGVHLYAAYKHSASYRLVPNDYAGGAFITPVFSNYTPFEEEGLAQPSFF
jgi:hypothetical protein|tara:strand:+ start:180 stop:377 length:198 start_codon:yes stop_codon:yes gene_type:complete